MKILKFHFVSIGLMKKKKMLVSNIINKYKHTILGTFNKFKIQTAKYIIIWWILKLVQVLH